MWMGCETRTFHIIIYVLKMELVHAEYSYKNRNDIIDDVGVVLPDDDDYDDHALC